MEEKKQLIEKILLKIKDFNNKLLANNQPIYKTVKIDDLFFKLAFMEIEELKTFDKALNV